MLHHLTLGRNIGDTGYVSDLDWELYCQEVLDANFDGYTVQDAMGSWKSMPEDSKVVIIDTADTQLVHDVAQLYKEMYQQEAVGLYTTSNMKSLMKCRSVLSSFHPSNEQDISKLVKQAASKSCDLDSIPTWLLKLCLEELLPCITHIVNLSLSMFGNAFSLIIFTQISYQI